MSATEEVFQGESLTMVALAASCTNGSCPTVYRTDRGTIVVQGYAVEGSAAGVDLPAGELLVEVPADLLAAAVRAQE
ncbi:hypothetical protein [Paractinoplanes brasiliensis]|uniref:Uncharacterized protein n=1 Tax=Paractinoplanes brasiliensis TaxID=52695 RepID=A0A4V3C8G1_9ACTN|nr:hypothetical protein [Actinoplanes brasiliensis]TDO41508.1 hypothetical protein C8E87_5241 [Actinoplanes brasiliensis]GID27207.1 hypothetical protein Abr02nite_21900 [Actinoplanes brasiliensis]